MKTILLVSLMALLGSSALAGDISCVAQREWLDDNGSLQKKAYNVPLQGKYPGLVKLELDLEDAFFSINDYEARHTTLSIVFPPDYTVGIVSRVNIAKGSETVLNSINGSDVFKLTCKK